ncbi:MAG: thrombospondin type 3 repeat-containing protein [Phycisphaerae bacterium]
MKYFKTGVLAIFGVILSVGLPVANAQPSVLIVVSDSGPPTSELLSTGMFSTVDVFFSSSGTPSLATLASFDRVLAYTNFTPANAVALGDVLADYVDAGGQLVLATYAFSSPWAISGRVMTSGYSPLVNVGVNGNVGGVLVATQPNDAVFFEVNLGALSYFHNSNFAHPGLDAGAALLATDGAGRNMIARSASGLVIGLNLFPRGGNWGGNNAELYQLVANAVLGDADPDGDGIDIPADNCPTVANPAQQDGDADGVGDACDNCPSIPNPDQTETAACISLVDQGSCFAAQFDLIGENLSGEVTVNQGTFTPITITFDGGSGNPLSYTESGMTVTSRYPSGPHLHFSGGTIWNHSGCCSTPYEFDFAAAPFTVVSLDVLSFGGPGSFTSSSGAVVNVTGTGTLTFPVSGWTGITSFRWDQFSGSTFIDNLVVEVGTSTPVSVTPYFDSQLPETIDISSLADGDYTLCVSATDAPATIDSIRFDILNTLCSRPGTYEFFLNGVSLGTAPADPTNSCTCAPQLQTFTVTNAGGLLTSAWNPSGTNTLSFTLAGNTLLSWVRAEVQSGSVSTTACIFDFGGGSCDVLNLCSAGRIQDQGGASGSTDAIFDTNVDCVDFTKQGEDRIAINVPCELDPDDDGVDDPIDNCPDTPNPNQTDRDADGVGDVCDNCPLTPNPGQGDSDGDGLGDCCEPDQPDCNGNGVPDGCDITEGTSGDCNSNNVPDECDISSGTSQDCNGNGIPDDCDIADGTSQDCNSNGIPDDCDIANGTSQDCNGNGIPDECDIASGVSVDCQPNGIPDNCDIDLGNSQDCNANGVPDECDIASGASDDCQPNGIPDDCEWAALLNQAGQSGIAALVNSSQCQLPDQQEHGGAFMVSIDLEAGTTAADSFTSAEATTITGVTWWGTYQDECGEPCDAMDDFVVTFYVSDGGPASVVVATYDAGGAVTRSATGQTIPFGEGFAEFEYSFDLVPPFSAGAGERFWVEMRNNTGASCTWWWETAPEGTNGNGTSLYDAEGDGYDDDDLAPYDLAFCVNGLPAAEDCNANGVPDSQDIFDGISQDCQPNGTPDECEDDGNFNGIPDTCDIVSGTSKDLNFNGLPDEADCLTTPGDLDGDCDVDRDDLAAFTACMGTSGADILAGCVCADFDRNGTVDMTDYLAFSGVAGQPVVGCRVRPADACPDSWTTAVGGGALAGVGGGVAGVGANETFYDFGLHGPIPAGFFAEGSDPFGEIVAFVGTPVDPSGVYGDMDTLIEHGLVTFDPETGEAQTTLDIIALDLMSKDPITVTHAGGNPEQWIVVAGLSPHFPPSGELTATLDDPDANSGTYDATVFVQPAFLFVNLQDLVDHVLPECVAVRVLDTGEPSGASARMGEGGSVSAGMPPITLSFTGQPFVRVADPSIIEQLSVPACAQGNFVPGVIEFGGGGALAAAVGGQQLTCTSHITAGEAHFFCPPECQGEDVCKYSAVGSPTPLGACSNLPTFPQAVLGQPCPNGVGQCRANVVKHKPCPGGGSAFQTYGSPSCVSRESLCKGACCNNQANCALSTAALCDGTYIGDDTRCGSITCPKGACCHDDGTCNDKAPTACNAPGDTYQGDGTTCANFEPAITGQPQDTDVCVGDDATFTIAATASSGALHYQWKKDGTDVGTDSPTLTFTNLQDSDNGAQITCEVKDDCGTVTSNTATLGVFGDATCPDCATATVSTLAAVEVALATPCGAGQCGVTIAPGAGTQVLVIQTCIDDGPCHIEFRVTADRDMEADPCPGAVTEITGGGDPDVTAANFCGLVDGFWNGGNGDGGGDCFVLGGTAYGQPACTELHEDVHVAEYVPFLNAELAVLLTRPSIAPIPMDGNPPSQSCAQAEAARTAAITADVNTAYANATTAWVAQGHSTGAPYAAEFPCATNVANSICQWAEDQATIDVDTCATCQNGALGVAYTDICGDNALNDPTETCDGTDDAGCPGACRADCTCPP